MTQLERHIENANMVPSQSCFFAHFFAGGSYGTPLSCPDLQQSVAAVVSLVPLVASCEALNIVTRPAFVLPVLGQQSVDETCVDSLGLT